MDVVELSEITSSAVINAMKSVFACHGIPQILRTYNGPQYASSEFETFCKQYGIEHETSSPHFQSSNGEAERAIQTVKRLWRKTSDKHLALLDYRTTQLPGLNFSPSQLLMGRRPRNILPSSDSVLRPKGHDSDLVKRHFNAEKQKQKMYYDQCKGAKDLQPLSEGTSVRMSPLPGSTSWKPGTVIEKHDKPRSYIVRSGERVYRRYRKHLRLSTQSANSGNSFDQDDFGEISLPDRMSTSGDLAEQQPPKSTIPTNLPDRGTLDSSATILGSPLKVTRSYRHVIPP